ncbi:MAG TPA: DNRLRE domain-containing protein [Herpetosiphonaceae bacterium]
MQEADPHQVFLPLMGMTDATEGAFWEAVDLRRPNTQVFVDTTGSQKVVRFRQYTQPVFFQDPTTKRWQHIDTRIIAGAQPGTYRNAAADFVARFAGRAAQAASTTPLLHVGRANQPTMSFRLPGGTLPTPTVADDTITYPGIAPASDLVYQVHSWGIKEEVVLHSSSAAASFTMLLDAPGVTLSEQPDRSWLARDTSGHVLWKIPAPIGADARNADAPVTLQITQETDARYRMTLAVAESWLKAPERVFPVRLDPSLADPRYFFDESYVEQDAPNTAAWHQRNRFVGYIDGPGLNKGITRIFAPIDLSFLPPGMRAEHINKVEMVFTRYTVADMPNNNVATHPYPALSPWDYETLTWNNQPAVGPAIGDGTVVAPGRGPNRWNITDWAKRVVGGEVPNYGVSIRADNETQPGAIFWSSQCTATGNCALTERPYLEVEVVLDSGLNPLLDTWSFPNREGLPDFNQFVEEYGLAATTHLITETRQLSVITSTNTMTLPISLSTIGLTATLPLTPTSSLRPAPGDTYPNGRYIPRPIAYAYEEVIVKAIYDDQFSEAYEGALKGGLCAGMAATVADFHSADSNRPRPDQYGGTDTVRSIPDNPLAQELIQKYHGRQVGSQVLNWLAQQGRYSATGLYNHLAAHIAIDWWDNPEIIGIAKGAGCDDIEIGHALLPYKIVPQPNNKARIYVYDSNYPPTATADAANRYLEIDFATNTWSYELAPATQARPAILWTGQTLYSTPLSLFRERPLLPTAGGTDVMMVNGGNRLAWGGNRLAWGGNRLAWGEDDGTHTGCYLSDSGPTFVQEIERSYRLTPLTGGLTPKTFPDTLFFPAGNDWTFVGTGTDSSQTSDMLFFGPHSLAGVISTSVDTSRDTAHIDAAFRSLSMRTTDAPKPVSLYQMHETDAWTRIYAISNTTLGPAEELKLTVSSSLDSFEVVNSAPVSKTLDVGFTHIGGDGIGTIVYPEQPIGGHERRIYTPIDWTDLAHSPILVEIDRNADGTIDRVELLGGDMFPAATLSTAVPQQPGAEFPILTHAQTAPGQFGWANLDYPLAPGTAPEQHMDSGNADVLRKWLVSGGKPNLQPGGGLVGVAGTHGNIFKAIGTPTHGDEALYRVGDLMIVPLYDHVVPRQGSRPAYYHIVGSAVVRITEATNNGAENEACTSNPTCNKRVMGRLLFKVIY